MKILKRLIYIIIILGLSFFIVSSFLKRANLKPVKAQLDSLDLSNVNKLMIITHPGDETVWGGAHLLQDDYLVVCVSCGFGVINNQKIEDVLNVTNDKLVMMGYSDKYLIRRDYKKVKKSLKKILAYKQWHMVVTHNPDGEYGNLEHKQVSDIVSSFDMDNLYYFGHYYSKKEMSKLDKVPSMKEEYIKDKTNKLIKIYNDKNLNKYSHMFPFEGWIGRGDYVVK